MSAAVHTVVSQHHSTTELRRLERILGGHQVPPPMGKGSLHGITQLPAQACPENPQGWELTMSLRRLCQWLLSLQNIPWWASSLLYLIRHCERLSSNLCARLFN